MVTNMNFLMGMLLAKDLGRQDQITAGALASQFRGNSLLGPVLLKPTLVDKANALTATEATVERQKATIATVEGDLRTAQKKIAAQAAFVADAHGKLTKILEENPNLDVLKEKVAQVRDDLKPKAGGVHGNGALESGLKDPATVQILTGWGVNFADPAALRRWMAEHPQAAAVLFNGAGAEAAR